MYVCMSKLFQSLGTDYMANFSPGCNFSLADRAEISARLLKQILLQSIVDYMERDSARGAIQPVFSARPNGPENLKKSHVLIEKEFQPGLKSRKQYGCHWEAEAISVELRR